MAAPIKKKKRPCTKCGKPNAVIPARLCSTCKRKSKAASRDAARNNRAVKVYGLEDGDYAKLYAASGGRCYICNGRGSGKLAIDHNHTTGEVRGLLCTRCNYHLLGRIGKDDPVLLREIMEKAIAYLEDPPSRGIL